MRAFLLILALAGLPVAVHAGDLHDAAKSGNIAAIEATLASGADINETDGIGPALYFAIRRGSLQPRSSLSSAAPTSMPRPALARSCWQRSREKTPS